MTGGLRPHASGKKRRREAAEIAGRRFTRTSFSWSCGRKLLRQQRALHAHFSRLRLGGGLNGESRSGERFCTFRDRSAVLKRGVAPLRRMDSWLQSWQKKSSRNSSEDVDLRSWRANGESIERKQTQTAVECSSACLNAPMGVEANK